MGVCFPRRGLRPRLRRVRRRHGDLRHEPRRHLPGHPATAGRRRQRVRERRAREGRGQSTRRRCAARARQRAPGRRADPGSDRGARALHGAAPERHGRVAAARRPVGHAGGSSAPGCGGRRRRGAGGEPGRRLRPGRQPLRADPVPDEDLGVDLAACECCGARRPKARALDASRSEADIYERLSTLLPDEPVIFLQLGQASFASGDTPAAIAAWERFLELAPDDASAPLIQQQLELLKGDDRGGSSG